MRPFHRSLIALIGFIAASAPLPARAQETTELMTGFAERLYAGAPNPARKTYACFVRVYDAAHLAQHPLQKVTAMKLLVTAEKMPEMEGLTHSFRLGLSFRNRPGNFDTSGYCGNARINEGQKTPRIGCAVDCDGGGIEIGMSPDNRSAMLYVETGVRIWRNNKPDDEASMTSLRAGADDRVFRLDRASLDQCRPLVHDRKELAAMRDVSKRR
jgi:hypothetical protein